MNNLELLLINPGSNKKRAYQDLSESYSAIEPPFWGALTAGFIRNQNHSVSIIDANAENLTISETAKQIEERNPKLTNIIVYGQHPSASTQLMSSVGELCKEIKKTNPERKIILSGLHPSALPQKTLEEESCDFVCQGEGFQTLKGLIEKKAPDKIPGLWYKENGITISNPRAKNTQNLTEELKDVAWDLLPFKNNPYRAHNWQCLDDFSQRPHYASLSTSLGCPFKCDFCSISATYGERQVRAWNPEWVTNQIQTLNEKYGIKVFKIIDEMFLLNPKHYLEIANEIIRRGINEDINIWAYARVDTTQHRHLERLRGAGIKWLCPGFESGSEEIIRTSHKGMFTRKDMIRTREEIKKAGINVIGNYMFGFPQDTEETMQQTLDLATEHNCEFVNFYCAVAWPGSKLYEEIQKQNIKIPEGWHNYAQHSKGFVPLPTEHLSPAEVLRFRDNAFQAYFSNPIYTKMIRNKFGEPAEKHINKMLEHKIKRDILT